MDGWMGGVRVCARLQRKPNEPTKERAATNAPLPKAEDGLPASLRVIHCLHRHPQAVALVGRRAYFGFWSVKGWDEWTGRAWGFGSQGAWACMHALQPNFPHSRTAIGPDLHRDDRFLPLLLLPSVVPPPLHRPRECEGDVDFCAFAIGGLEGEGDGGGVDPVEGLDLWFGLLWVMGE